MTFWKKKKEKIQSEEYKELLKRIGLIEIDLDLLQSRYKRKAHKTKEEAEKESPPVIDDGLDELRKLNKL